MKTTWKLVAFGFIISTISRHVQGTSNATKKRSPEEYYQINYDYEVLNNNSLDVEFSSDSLILPIPDDAPVKDSTEESEKMEKNVDGDLKDHDFIDNLMYIYGPRNKSGRKPLLTAPEIIIGGSVLSIIAQVSTILLVVLKKDIHAKKSMKKMFLHLMGSFCTTNLFFIFGVFDTFYTVDCLTVALMLTYFHLMASVWIFLYCFHVYKVFCMKEHIKRKYYFAYGYGLPLIYSLLSFLLAPQSYESCNYCFMSVQRGMILNYMIPVFCLIILTAVYCIKGIGIFNMELSTLQANSNLDTLTLYTTQMEVVMGKKCTNIDAVNLRASKSCLRRLCAMQTMYDIVWFFLVLALENMNEGSTMAVVYAFLSCCLNWYIFAEVKVFFPVANKPKHKEATSGGASKLCNGAETIDLSPVTSESKQGSSDSVPLLIESTELKVLHHNPNISTISI